MNNTRTPLRFPFFIYSLSCLHLTPFLSVVWYGFFVPSRRVVLPAQKRRGWLISLFDDIFRFRTWISFLSSFPDRLMRERDLRFPIRVGLVNLSCRWFDLITCRWFRCKWLIRWNPSFRLLIMHGCDDVSLNSNSRGNQREVDRQRAQARKAQGKQKDDGMTPEQRRERYPFPCSNWSSFLLLGLSGILLLITFFLHLIFILSEIVILIIDWAEKELILSCTDVVKGCKGAPREGS